MLHKYMPGDTRERIKDLLSEAKMNQEELAEKLGISGSSLNRYISGQTEKLSTDNIVAMAKIFHVSTDFLLCLTDIPFKTNYDIEHLGLSVGAAKMLLKKRIRYGYAEYPADPAGLRADGQAAYQFTARNDGSGRGGHESDDRLHRRAADRICWSVSL